MLKLLKISLIALALTSSIYAEDEENEHRSVPTKPLTKQDKSTLALYTKECGSCHMAYQPQFLPKRSWDKMMNTLDGHFGADASLDGNDFKTIQNYLLTHASKNDNITDTKGSLTLRISETSSFKREHREIKRKMVTQPAVKSFANCNACHTQATSGNYSERTIKITNYGRWED